MPQTRLNPGLFLLRATMLFVDVTWGQCVMCKAVAEDSSEDGSLGRGLNAGILYLMGVPYAIMAFFAWFVFKRKKQPHSQGV